MENPAPTLNHLKNSLPDQHGPSPGTLFIRLSVALEIFTKRLEELFFNSDRQRQNQTSTKGFFDYPDFVIHARSACDMYNSLFKKEIGNCHDCLGVIDHWVVGVEDEWKKGLNEIKTESYLMPKFLLREPTRETRHVKWQQGLLDEKREEFTSEEHESIENKGKDVRLFEEMRKELKKGTEYKLSFAENAEFELGKPLVGDDDLNEDRRGGYVKEEIDEEIVKGVARPTVIDDRDPNSADSLFKGGSAKDAQADNVTLENRDTSSIDNMSAPFQDQSTRFAESDGLLNVAVPDRVGCEQELERIERISIYSEVPSLESGSGSIQSLEQPESLIEYGFRQITEIISNEQIFNEIVNETAEELLSNAALQMEEVDIQQDQEDPRYLSFFLDHEQSELLLSETNPENEGQQLGTVRTCPREINTEDENGMSSAEIREACAFECCEQKDSNVEHFSHSENMISEIVQSVNLTRDFDQETHSSSFETSNIERVHHGVNIHQKVNSNKLDDQFNGVQYPAQNILNTDSPQSQQLISHTFHWKYGGRGVHIAGSFDPPYKHWDPIPMNYNNDSDLHEIVLNLHQNWKYLFKYLVDGKWMIDPSIPIEQDKTGLGNNFVIKTLPVVEAEPRCTHVTPCPCYFMPRKLPRSLPGSSNGIDKPESYLIEENCAHQFRSHAHLVYNALQDELDSRRFLYEIDKVPHVSKSSTGDSKKCGQKKKKYEKKLLRHSQKITDGSLATRKANIKRFLKIIDHWKYVVSNLEDYL
ncbi:14433_t:CDS:2 [Acaulospora morrowiae]|uniref:14433_t:CDS:1 n=1 Tax=Acaulospora morrowiae TaxID=94023 RepID=A0A9N9FUF2_9GLOM|nr:14433_t:CDS:2 [Acaulospora morrowiae]